MSTSDISAAMAADAVSVASNTPSAWIVVAMCDHVRRALQVRYDSIDEAEAEARACARMDRIASQHCTYEVEEVR